MIDKTKLGRGAVIEFAITIGKEAKPGTLKGTITKVNPDGSVNVRDEHGDNDKIPLSRITKIITPAKSTPLTDNAKKRRGIIKPDAGSFD